MPRSAQREGGRRGTDGTRSRLQPQACPMGTGGPGSTTAAPSRPGQGSLLVPHGSAVPRAGSSCLHLLPSTAAGELEEPRTPRQRC